VQSARAVHQAARAALEAKFFTDWRKREPYASFNERFLCQLGTLKDWPAPAEYDALARTVPQPDSNSAELPRFVLQPRETRHKLGGYEQQVAAERAVPTRERSWHDFFNMLVWAHFPRVRWALNALHVDKTLGPIDTRNGRAPTQNVAAQLDESGIVVVSSAPRLLSELRALCFKQVFWKHRAELLATTRFWVIGHGALESLLAPHLGLAAKAVLLELPRPPATYDANALRYETDARVARLIDGWRNGPPVLDPIPLLGIPGYADNTASEFYDDARYFRFQRQART
jgi:hypothetical protein